MAKILAIVRQDLLVFLSRRSNLPGLLFTPILMTVIIGLVSGGAFNSPTIHRLDLIDQDGTQASAQFIAAIRQANPNLTVCPMDNTAQDLCNLGKSASLTESQALDRVANSTSQALLEIPAGFEANLASQKPSAVTFRSASSYDSSQAAQEAVQTALSQINGAAVASQVGLATANRLLGQPLAADQASAMKSAVYQSALAMAKKPNVTVQFSLSSSTQRSAGQSLQSGLGQSVPGMGAMFVLTTIFGGMAALILERQQWTLQRLAVMPVSRATMLAGKILARFCLGLLQFAVVLIAGAMLGMRFGKDPLGLLLLVMVFTLSITAISFAIGSGLKNATQASGLSLLLTLTLAPLGGAWWPLDITPRFMQIIGHCSPVAWAMDGFSALIYNGAHLGDILVPIGVLLGMAALAFAIAIPRFRYQVD